MKSTKRAISPCPHWWFSANARLVSDGSGAFQPFQSNLGDSDRDLCGDDARWKKSVLNYNIWTRQKVRTCPPAIPRPPGCFRCFPMRPWPLLTWPRCLRTFLSLVGISNCCCSICWNSWNCQWGFDKRRRKKGFARLRMAKRKCISQRVPTICRRRHACSFWGGCISSAYVLTNSQSNTA